MKMMKYIEFKKSYKSRKSHKSVFRQFLKWDSHGNSI